MSARPARPADQLVAIGPASGGVAHVFVHVVEQMRSAGWTVHSRQLGTTAHPNAEALRAVRELLPALRRSGVIHVEFGSNDVAAFWFLFWACLLRRDVTAVAHDVSLKLVRSPAAGLVSNRSRWAVRVGYRLLSPVLDRPAEALVRRRVRQWGVMSEDARQRWQPRVRGRVGVLSHGADPPTPRRSAPSAGAFVLFAGYLSPMKGIDLLVESWGTVGGGTDLELVIAGDAAGEVQSEFVDRLQATSEKQDSPPRWRAGLADDVFAELFRTAALVVLPYRASSAASGILVRAMVEGCCVLATDVPAVREALTPEVEGVVVPPDDGPALTQALQELLADPARRDELGAAAAARAARDFTWARQVETLSDLYAGR